MKCCCLKFKYEVEEGAVLYLPAIRSFVIETKYDNEVDINYCLWCGHRLAKDLTNELTDLIYEQFKLEGYEDPRMPEEFRSERWWLRRGF